MLFQPMQTGRGQTDEAACSKAGLEGGGRVGTLVKSKTKENLTTSFNIHTDRQTHTDTERQVGTHFWGHVKDSA